VPAAERLAHVGAVHGGAVGVDQAGAVQLAQDGHDAAGAVHVLHVHIALGGGDLAQARGGARQPVDVGHGEGHAALVGRGQKVQHGVGRTAHGDVQPHGVLEGGEVGDVARQDALVVLVVVTVGQVDGQAAGFEEQAFAVAVGGQHRAVAGQ